MSSRAGLGNRRSAGVRTEGDRARRFVFATLLVMLLGLLGACSRHAAETWDLTEIRGYLPDLGFSLKTGGNRTITAADLRGKVVLLYFGYTHCPDVCPTTMAKMAGVLHELGASADGVRLLFVSVDPKRDTPALVEAYAKAFGPQCIGAVGTAAETEDLARKYRVAYEALKPDSDGNYDVMHSKGIYVFDGRGRARLLISDTDKSKAIEHDLRQLVSPRA